MVINAKDAARALLEELFREGLISEDLFRCAVRKLIVISNENRAK